MDGHARPGPGKERDGMLALFVGIAIGAVIGFMLAAFLVAVDRGDDR